MGVGKLNTEKPKSISLNSENGIIHDKKEVAEKFNNYFTNIAGELVKKLEVSSGKYGLNHVTEYYNKKGISMNEFSWEEVSEDDIINILNNLPESRASGLNDLPAKLLKDGFPAYSKYLTRIINISIHLGKVPRDWKCARVIPLHKKGCKTEIGNYRPVSILTIVSKIVERLIHDQLMAYFNKKSLIFDFQSGFRPSFSTDSCLIHLSDHIKKEWDRGNLTGMVVLDLQKAFDTVDHSILLDKFKAMGLSENALFWFDSYLNDRWQLVDNGGVYSSLTKTSCGVPQGSILGPLLFLVYVNDMESATSCKLLLYADDSALVVSDRNSENIQNKLSNELQSVNSWLLDNKLSLHLGKTSSILFGSKRMIRNQPELRVQCNGNLIKNSPSVEYLGLVLDHNLNCDEIG